MIRKEIIRLTREAAHSIGGALLTVGRRITGLTETFFLEEAGRAGKGTGLA